MRSQRRVLMVGVAVSALSIVVLITIVDVGAAFATFGRANLLPLGGILLVISGQLLLRTVRWRYLLPTREDGSRPALTRLVPILAVGYMANTVMPARLGEPIRAYLAARRERLDFALTLGSVVLERAIDLATLAGIAFLAAIAAGAPTWMITGTAAVGGMGWLLILLLLSRVIQRPARWSERRLPAASRRSRALLRSVGRFADGAGRQSRSVVTLAVSVSATTWLLDGLTFWLVAAALGLELSYGAALLIAAVTVLGTAIPSAPGYLGTFELAAVTSASALGIASSDALALALLTHVLTTVPLAGLGAASLGAMSLRLRSVAAQVTADAGPAR